MCLTSHPEHRHAFRFRQESVDPSYVVNQVNSPVLTFTPRYNPPRRMKARARRHKELRYRCSDRERPAQRAGALDDFFSSWDGPFSRIPSCAAPSCLFIWAVVGMWRRPIGSANRPPCPEPHQTFGMKDLHRCIAREERWANSVQSRSSTGQGSSTSFIGGWGPGRAAVMHYVRRHEPAV